jgi:hypothetical protein
MATEKISISDLTWMIHEKLKEYGDYPHYGIALAVVRAGDGDWKVITDRKMLKRKPDIADRINSIEKQLRKRYRLAAE